MKNMILSFFVFTLLTSLFSCQNKDNNSRILLKAESLRDSNPDSVLILLESIKTPENLNKKQYATYLLLQAEAKDKMDKDLSDNTPLTTSIDFFTKAKLYKQAAYAYFYQNRIYQSQNQTALAIEHCFSAKNYAEKITDPNLRGLIYRDLGNQYKDSVHKDMMSQKLLEIQKKYENKSIENEKDELTIQRLYFFLICLFVIFSMLCVVIFFIYKNKKHKSESLKKHQELLFLEEILESENSKENKLKELLIEKLDVAKKVVLMKTHTNINDSEFVKQFYKIFGRNISDTLEWNNLYPIFDELYNNFTLKLKQDFPALTEKELQFCCLIKADFSSDEIGLFLSYEYNSVRANKVRLRKKMEFETHEDFMKYIYEL